MSFPTVALSEIAYPVTRPVSVLPGVSYRTIGVKWWGMGAYERETIDGSQTAAKTLSLVREGDLIINKIWVRHGSTAIASKSVGGCAASGEFPTFELDRTKVLPSWIHWLTKSRVFWSKCDALSHGTSGKNRIRPELFLTIQIPLPPRSEQYWIVAKIEELTTKIEDARGLRREAVEEAEALVNASAQRLLAGFNVELTELRCWLDQTRDGIQTGPFGAQLSSQDFESTGVPVLSIGNIQYHGFELNSLKYVSEEKAQQLSRFSIREDPLCQEPKTGKEKQGERE